MITRALADGSLHGHRQGTRGLAHQGRRAESPLGDGKEYVAVPALPVDWAFLHVGEADKYGNGRHPGAAAGYKQLLEVERGWRDLKTTLELRPVFHHREDRIRAHVQLCWLALLLIRVAETTTGQTWPVMRRELDRLHAGTFTGQTGTFRQRTELTKPQRDLFTALEVTPPPQMLELAATSG